MVEMEPAAKKIVIVGAGTGGTLIANRLHRHYGEAASITVLDVDDEHVYQPGLLFVPFGLARSEDIVRSRSGQLHKGIEFRQAVVDRVDIEQDQVLLEDGGRLEYDVLIIASGASLQTEETEGLSEAFEDGRVSGFYTLKDAEALHQRLEGFEAGHLVVNPVDMPIKCPVAPLEFCFLADWYFRERGVREQIRITYVTPLDGAFTKPVASAELGGLLTAKGIAIETEFATGKVEDDRLVSWDGREVAFDLLVAIPAHGGVGFVSRSGGLGDELGFIKTDLHTLQSLAAPNVFAIGDATNLPTSKAGSVTHFEGDTLTANIERFFEGRELEGSFDGHANCFVETGFHKALLIDFNYEVEPLEGRYPTAHVGLPLLRESRLNHMAKLAFQPFYWHALLPGRDVPGLKAQMSMSGKRSPSSKQGEVQ